MPGPMMRKINNMPKEKTDFKSLGKLIVFCKKYLPLVIIAIIFGIGSAVCSIIGPEKIENITNQLYAAVVLPLGLDMGEFGKVCITLVIIYIIGAIIGYGSQFLMATVTQAVSKKLRSSINKKISKVPLNYFDTTTKGDLLSRVTNDVDIISQTLSSSTANLISALTLFIGVVIKMFTNNWMLSLITIGTSLFGFVFMGIILRFSQKYFNRKQVDLGIMDGQIEEVYTNHNVVSAFGGKKSEIKKFNKTNGDLYVDNKKSQFLSGMMMPIMNFVGNFSNVLIFIVCITLILNGSKTVTPGTISSFILYARLFSQPLSTFAQSMTSLQQTSAASRRVFEFLETEEMANEDEKTFKLETVKGNVEFKHVNFGYLSNKTIIHDFSAKLSAGQKVAIVGPTGAGKTTIVNLLMRFYECNGDITIDGVSTKDMKREDVQGLFDMILQDTWLFDGTIRENLVFNQENVSDEKLYKVCEAVGLKHFIDTLPQGFDTMLTDNLNLSEGQKQQLTIARAMIKDSPLLILDEATSSVDTRTELIIQEAMDNLTKGRTSFVIAHRLSTIKNADTILVMKDGDIIEQGSHSELLAKNGFYAELYNSQFATT